MTTESRNTERGRDGLREAIRRLLNDMGDPLDPKHLHPQAASLMFQLEDLLAEHPATGDEEPCVCRDSEFCSCQQPPPGALIAAEIDRLSAEGSR
jgi:hypothetical protein